jgi:SAM-dependent methyltransferase
MMLGAAFVWRPTGELASAVASGQPAFEHVYGTQFFRYLAQNRDDAAIFNAAMSSAPAWIDAVVNAYDFTQFEQIVDVGGGRGALLVGILSANPRLRGVLYDLPGVADNVETRARESVADRLEVMTGDFFDSVPAGADAYLLSGVIHDWPDEPAARILKNVRRAIRPQGRLLVLDAVLTRSNDPAQAMMDLAMMVLTGGQERSESQFRSLLNDAGFSLMNVRPTMGASVLESRPI